jgi:hypothetical protein
MLAVSQHIAATSDTPPKGWIFPLMSDSIAVDEWSLHDLPPELLAHVFSFFGTYFPIENTF